MTWLNDRAERRLVRRSTPDLEQVDRSMVLLRSQGAGRLERELQGLCSGLPLWVDLDGGSHLWRYAQVVPYNEAFRVSALVTQEFPQRPRTGRESRDPRPDLSYDLLMLFRDHLVAAGYSLAPVFVDGWRTIAFDATRP